MEQAPPISSASPSLARPSAMDVARPSIRSTTARHLLPQLQPRHGCEHRTAFFAARPCPAQMWWSPSQIPSSISLVLLLVYRGRGKSILRALGVWQKAQIGNRHHYPKYRFGL